MNSDDLKNSVKQLYKARLSNSVDNCMQCFSESASFSLAGEGAATMGEQENSTRATIETLIEGWDWQEISDQTILLDGDSAAVFYILLAVFKPTGEQVRTSIADHLEFDDNGKVTSMVQYLDTAMVERMLASANHRAKQPSEYYP